MGDLDGKIAIVTGGSRGIGRGIALALAKAGAAVAIAGRTQGTLEGVADEIRETGRRALAVVCDVGEEAQVRSLVAETVGSFGRLDILVNNAQSWGSPDERLAAPPAIALQDLPEEWWDHTFRTGVKATYFCCKAAFPHLRERGGKVINFGSHAGITGAAELPDYAANKEAIRGLSRSLARAWGRYGINVNIIVPAIETEAMLARRLASPERAAAAQSARVISRWGEPERDAGAVAVFLAGPGSDYITGQSYFVNGGYVMV